MIAEGALAPEIDVAQVKRMAQGDEGAAHGLIEAYGDSLFRFVLRRTLGSIEDAEEIVQDVFVTSVRLGQSFDGTCTVFTWLCSLARLKIHDYRKTQMAQKRSAEKPQVSLDDHELGILRKVHDPSIAIEDIANRIDQFRLVQALLDSMSAEQREAVTLRYIEEFSVKETSRIMNRSEKAIERLLERAKERPRQEMARWFSDESFRAICLEVLVL